MTAPIPDTMIERVARILCDQDLGDPDAVIQGEGAIAGMTYFGWEAYETNARDVIAAMLEPTDAMLVAGLDKAKGLASDPYDFDRSALHELYQVMIEAELPEEA